MLSLFITQRSNKGGGRKFWEVMNMSMALMVAMVSQVLTIPKLTELYTLNIGFSTNNTPFLLQNLLLQNHKHVIL